ncbi:MAG: fasciclin domain-containing protein [Bacteroidota bacterium]
MAMVLAMGSTVKSQSKDIVDLAVGNDGLKTLVAAVKAGGLVDVLKSDGPFTVFAPTDEAFAALPEGTLESLLKPENKDQLVDILKYHVVSGKIMSTDLSNGQKATTVQGEKIKVAIKSGGVKIENANVVAADVKAKNGVVHVIDAVILPPSMR